MNTMHLSQINTSECFLFPSKEMIKSSHAENYQVCILQSIFIVYSKQISIDNLFLLCEGTKYGHFIKGEKNYPTPFTRVRCKHYLVKRYVRSP